MTKIEQKQDELIKSLKELVNLCDAPQYFEIIAAKKAMKEIVEHHESELSSLKAMEGEDVSDEVRDYFDLIYDNIPVSVDNCILPDHAREELANILNAAMRDNLIKKADDHT